MSRRFRMLSGQNSTTTAVTEPPPEPDNVDSDFVVILAALLCALICVLGLVAVARCTWIRRISGIVIVGRTDQSPPAAANKGLKKKILKTLPKLTYSTETMAEKFSDCAICLTEFVAGDEIRVLPLCGHGFHVTCIDTWFGSHSSCPSCRQILVASPRCKKCGELPAAELTGAQTSTTAGETSASIDRFLP
ncbi:RING-H2 finger protein ATL8-like [Cynara cardunculus var. scolymus]|uniref:Zinc finger, RING/FYVE/PHD-type n=1 Tax=Cynara cardunculus var. scolymus TaxID=59895 RepID=A0A103XKJ6_CYNCS|nr:RING-H2 finger protein ATL8-like [Cynara cardunculus var. scolymus]KVH92465.1 Zinc finger, RING/FYVE/PHD-type [Cynara cardunculus var. scolymus]